MQYTFQQLNHEANKLIQIPPRTLTNSEKKIAIVAHVFYIDLWEEIYTYLQQLSIEYDLFVSVPEGMSDKDIMRIFNTYGNVNVYMSENRGRDVLPFLNIVSIFPENSYTYICKIHTKKTGDSSLGQVWRKLLYFDLLGSDTTVKNILNMFEHDPKIGIVTGKNTILDSGRYAYGNDIKIDYLADKTDILYNRNYVFPAGTMFWIRSELLKELITLFKDEELLFEEEKGQKDNTLAHAIERFFGIICQEKGQSIQPSPSDYTYLNHETISELANLVLSQQYGGVDMFVKQKHIIEEKDQYIKEKDQYIKEKDQYIETLKALAESMRIKNRLKRLFPSNIKSKTSKIIALFATIRNNPQILKKVFYYIVRGDIKYLWNKTKEKSNKNLTESTELIEVTPSEYFTTFNEKQYLIKDTSIDIIIPVYNGYEFLEKLFDSIEKNTLSPHRLIVINDASPDERVKPYLMQRLNVHKNALFLNHEKNQGFLKSVNEAYGYVSNHFLILNTDTEVPEFWMERLMYPILTLDKIASTTPFTNSGEIASFPNFVADNSIFDHMDVNTLDSVFRNVKADNFYEAVPTGVGFCMGVNYNLTKNIGMFVEDTFGKGYGEENDWCQRAIKEGYTNLIVPNLYVYHKHGGSFSIEEKAKLLKINAAKLLSRHPNYGKDVDAYIQKDPHKTLRNMLVLMAADAKVGTHLIFDHDLGGGANIYAQDYVEGYTKKRHNVLYIKYDYYTDIFKLFHSYKKYRYTFKIVSLDELKVLLSKLHIKKIFLNSLVSFKHPLEMIEYLTTLVKDTEASLTIPIHDYYALCPSYTLLNDKGDYCNVPNLDTCRICMDQNTQEWRNYHSDAVNMPLWREAWLHLLEQSHSILCFSNASKEILLKAYPTLDTKSIEVIPHQVKPLSPVIANAPETETVTLGILGAINYAKGSQIIKHLIKAIEQNELDVNVVLIGEISEDIKSTHFHTTGRYERNNLPQIVADEAIDMFIIPSIWPETFSYTSQEIMMMDIPLIVFDIGAPAERVKKYTKGYIIDEINVNAILQKISEIKHIPSL